MRAMEEIIDIFSPDKKLVLAKEVPPIYEDHLPLFYNFISCWRAQVVKDRLEK